MLKIDVTDRLAVYGASGEGKTTLVVKLAKKVPAHWPILIIDPKPAKAWINFADKTLKKPEDVLTFTGRARVHVDSFERGAYDEYLKAAWERRRILVIIDELQLLLMHGITDALRRLLVAGRELKIGCWSLATRPVKFLEAFTEATVAVAFHLNAEKDVKRLSERGADFSANATLKPHEYMYHRKGDRTVTIHRLATAGKKPRRTTNYDAAEPNEFRDTPTPAGHRGRGHRRHHAGGDRPIREGHEAVGGGNRGAGAAAIS